MAKVRDMRNYYKSLSKSSNRKSPEKIPTFLSSASGSAAYLQPKTAKKYSTVPRHIKNEVGEYSLLNGTKLAVEKFKKKYPKYTFIRTSINNWKNKIQRDKNDPGSSTVHERRGRPNLSPDELMLKVKDVITGLRLAGGVISRKMVMAIGTGVVKANFPSKLKEFSGHIVLTEGWARNVLKSMAWSKRKGTTGKIEPSEQFLLEEKLTFQRQISTVINDHDIPKDLIVNLDQTPLSYVCPGKYTFNPKGAKTVPIKGIDNKRQISATFVISMTGEFLPIQLTYEGKTKRCLPNFDSPASFNVTFSNNHWPNTEKSKELFEDIIFPYFEKVKVNLKYPKQQLSLIIMNTLKGQDNEAVLELCRKNNCKVIIVPHNLTNKSHPLDITVNKPAKSFISNSCNEWFSQQVSQQLEKGIRPVDVKVFLNLTELKVMHAKWISKLYDFLCAQDEIILNGFKAAGITEAVESANAVLERIENPFRG